MSKRKGRNHPETAERLSSPYSEKRRRLDPTKWKADEVTEFLMGRCKLAPEVASAVGISGEGLRAALVGGHGEWDISAAPQSQQTLVRRAGMDLVDPLMPKFMLYDADSSGELDADEFQHLAEAVTGTLSSPSNFKKLMATVDLDGNGTVSFAEFKHFVEHSSNPSSMFEHLAEVEDAVLGKLQPYFIHGAEPSLCLGVHNSGGGGPLHGIGGAPVRPMKRLALSSRAKACSGLCGLVLLAVVNIVAALPILFLSDFAVTDRLGSAKPPPPSSAFDGGLLFRSWTDFDAEKVRNFGIVEIEKPGSTGDCIEFVKGTCSWVGGNFGSRQFRDCSRVVHPDKKGGSRDDFQTLQRCYEVLSTIRSVSFLSFISAAASFCFVFTFLAGVSSSSAALGFAATSASRVELLLGTTAVAAAPDLAESFRVFVGLYAAGHVALTALLITFRGQSCFSEWVSGVRICRVTTGSPAPWWLLVCRDLAQGILDTAVVLAMSWSNDETLESRVHFVVNLGVYLLLVTPVLSFFERRPIDLVIGTVLLSQVRQKVD